MSTNKDNYIHKTIALAGNPNVGKSTIFNKLTGLNQKTGNWAGKTVSNAKGSYIHKNINYTLVDIPGTYSLMSNSKEEEIARNYICFSKPDVIVIVCDATCLEKNLNLVLQILEITNNVIICINLMDEAEKKGIKINTNNLSRKLGIPIITTSARNNKGLDKLINKIDVLANKPQKSNFKIEYNEHIEEALSIIEPCLNSINCKNINKRWLALKLLKSNDEILNSLRIHCNFDLENHPYINEKVLEAQNYLFENDINFQNFDDIIVSEIISKCEEIYSHAVSNSKQNYDKKLDRFLTSKLTGIPVMIILFSIIFWITISGSNYPSNALASFLLGLQTPIWNFLTYINLPIWVANMLTYGLYRVLAWVVSVMLPPMAIFFPLFSLLEDSGYLPRIAFNLDKCFQKASTSGKQALTMCMGFGCNAVGVTGCRIIESTREKIIAIITNSFVPCNGRFPMLITLISIFLIGNQNSILSAIVLTCFIVFSVLLTFFTSNILSKTILKGEKTSFILELPPYRKPQFFRVIVHSIFDKTLVILARAVSVSAPAGLLIWLMANSHINDVSLLTYLTNFLDPFAKLMGLDGTILTAFILAFPANEIVIPIILMSYASSSTITEYSNLIELGNLLIANGWTWITAVCTMLFSLMHWPCSTTVLTIKKETNSIKWTLVSILLPTIMGILACITVATIGKIFI